MDAASRTEVTIAAGDVSLGATLYRPAGTKDRLPAVVIAHGSAPTTRKMVGFFTNLGLRLGFAVLAFDKRGTGQSTGTFEEFSVAGSGKILHDQASDVAHAARWLATQPGIDAGRIGLLGGSQAGWVMPIAAANSPQVKFIVALAGVPLQAGQADFQQVYLNAVNNPQDERFALRQIYAADIAAIDYKGPPGFDPATVLKSSTTPTLWVFGLFDYHIPTLPSIERIGELQKAGKRNHEVVIVPFAEHNFRNIFTGERYDVTGFILPWLIGKGVIR